MINIQQGNLFWGVFFLFVFWHCCARYVSEERLNENRTLKQSNWVCHSKSEESKCIKHTFYGSKWSGYVVVNLTRSATVEWKSQHQASIQKNCHSLCLACSCWALLSVTYRTSADLPRLLCICRTLPDKKR